MSPSVVSLARPIFQNGFSRAIVVSSMLSASTLAAAYPAPTNSGNRPPELSFHTASTPPQVTREAELAAKNCADELFDLKSRSGMTWEELAGLFDVSRRSLHHWMNGKPLSPENELTLSRLRAFVYGMDKADHLQARVTLLAPTLRGKTIYDLLASGRFDDAAKELQRLPTAPKVAASVIPDEGRPHPIAYLDGAADLSLPDTPKGAKSRRLNIHKVKSKG